jgi:hypothetical protein
LPTSGSSYDGVSCVVLHLSAAAAAAAAAVLFLALLFAGHGGSPLRLQAWVVPPPCPADQRAAHFEALLRPRAPRVEHVRLAAT